MKNLDKSSLFIESTGVIIGLECYKGKNTYSVFSNDVGAKSVTQFRLPISHPLNTFLVVGQKIKVLGECSIHALYEYNDFGVVNLKAPTFEITSLKSIKFLGDAL